MAATGVEWREALDQLATGALRGLAAAHGLTPDEAATRHELLERLLERLADQTYVAEQVAALTDAERAALLEVGAAGGQTRGFLLEKRHAAAVPDLLAKGLLFRTFTAAGPRRGEVFAAPDDVLARLPQPESAETVAAMPPSVDPPAERRTTDPAFNLFTLASFLARHHTGRASPAAFADEVSWVAEPGGWEWQERWACLRHLGQVAGLLTRRADGDLAPAPGLAELLSEPPALHERLWRAYLRTREWSELARAPAQVPHGAILAEQVDPTALRAVVLDAVARLGEGVWVAFDAFAEWMRQTQPTFLREQLDARSAALRDPTTDQPLLDQPESWARVEVPLLRSILLGPLYWLGAVASSPDGQRVAITRAGSGLLGSQTAELLARPLEPCTWQDETLLAPPRADLGALLRAERYLELRERGRPSVYRLERERLAETLAAGGSVAECRGLLERLTQDPLPTRVVSDLDTWAERFGALSLRPAVLLEARSAAELEAALEPRPVHGLVKRRLGPLAAEVAASDALEVAAALRGAGHLPRVDAALALLAGRRAYAGLVDEQVLEFLLVSLLAFERARPEQLAELEGAPSLIERLEGLFPGERLAGLREAARRLADGLQQAPPRRRSPRSARRKR